jgi:hypothetical protein
MLLLRGRLKWVLAAAILAVAAGAGAQPAQPAPKADVAVPVLKTDAQVGFQRKAQLSPQEQLAEADVIIAKMEAGGSGLRKMLDEARQKRDVVKTLCLNDKLSQHDVAVRSARDRKTALQAAVNRNDLELSTHEFTILTVLKGRHEQLRGEANQCIGEEAAFLGSTAVQMTVSDTVPPLEPEYQDTNNTFVSGPQISASPTL